MNLENFFQRHSRKVLIGIAAVALLFLATQCARAQDLAEPPSIQDYNGDLGTMNLHSEYSWCVSKRMEEMGVGGQGAAAILAMEKAQQACSVTIQAHYRTAQMAYQAQAAKAQQPKWWHRLIPSGDTILSVGANAFIATKQFKYQTRRDEAMFGAFESLGTQQMTPGSFEVIGAEGSQQYLNFDSNGSFNEGGTAFGSTGAFSEGFQKGEDSFNTRTDQETTTTTTTTNTGQ